MFSYNERRKAFIVNNSKRESFVLNNERRESGMVPGIFGARPMSTARLQLSFERFV